MFPQVANPLRFLAVAALGVTVAGIVIIVGRRP